MDLPALIQKIPSNQKGITMTQVNPFADESPFQPKLQVANDVSSATFWYYDEINKTAYLEKFNQCELYEGKLSGAAAKPILEESGLPKDMLAQIWQMSDWTKDGKLNSEEFVVAMHMIHWVQSGGELPDVLPLTMLPSHRS